MNFCGKVVLLTGASSGIGAATAAKFAKLGADMILSGRNVKNLEIVAKKCNEFGNKAQLAPGDIAKEDDIDKIWTKALKAHGKVDILVNAAGIIEDGTIESTSMEQYDRIMNVNLRSMYKFMMLAAPELIKVKGNIVNISSVCGTRSCPGVLAYNISKAGVSQLTSCVALELGPKGVRVNSVNPGVIITNLHKRSGMNEETYAKFLEHSKTTHALGRPGLAEEVANGIAFLASDLASFTTAVHLAIDGGRHAMCPR